MIKKCKWCGSEKQLRSNQDYCSPKCRKAAEVSKRRTPKGSSRGKSYNPPTGEGNFPPVTKPEGLNEIAGAYWDKIAPILTQRGYLNVLSEDAFAELCDLHSRLTDINHAINETNRSLLQIVEQWDNKNATENQQFKESALSDLKRKYSARFMDYCKQFYLTPYSVRGNFGLEDPKDKGDELDQFMKNKGTR